jgi:hypothetical protein
MIGLDLPENLLLIGISSFGLVTIATIFSWWYNEKKFKRIIQREIKKGMERDELEN